MLLLQATRLGLLGRVLERRRRLVRRVSVDRREVLGRAMLPTRWGFEKDDLKERDDEMA